MFRELVLPTTLGSYNLLHELGRGAFSRVYEAIDTRTGHPCAVKLYFAASDGDGFVRELGACLNVRHPNLIAGHDIGYLDASTRFVAFDLARGGALRDRLRHEKVDSSFVRHVIIEVARALTVLHASHLVHRDVKPENILFDTNDPFSRVRLGDLGTADRIQQRRALGEVGSPAYMAPEQIRGSCDTRADVYSLAVIAYEMLAGSRPFLGSPAEVLRGHLESAPDVSLFSSAVAAVLNRGLAKKADDRFSEPRAFARALDVALEGDSEAHCSYVDTALRQGRASCTSDGASGWRLLPDGPHVAHLGGPGAPSASLRIPQGASTALAPTSLAVYALRTDKDLVLGVDGNTHVPAPLYGLPALVVLSRHAGWAISAEGGATPSVTLRDRDGGLFTRVPVTAPLSALTCFTTAESESVVGVDIQHRRIVGFSLDTPAPKIASVATPSPVRTLRTRKGKCTVELGDGRELGLTMCGGIPTLIPIDTSSISGRAS